MNFWFCCFFFITVQQKYNCKIYQSLHYKVVLVATLAEIVNQVEKYIIVLYKIPM